MFKAPAQISLYFLFIILVAFAIMPRANAQTVIRDTEIETYLNEWFAPILDSAGMQASQVKIILIQSNDVNAFVAGGSNIFFYTGLIEKTENPGELIGVMAHELGHISGGHLVRGRAALEQASYESLLGTLLGLGAAVATGDAGAAAAGSLASNSIAQRRFLATSRTYESSADQAAITSMNRAKMNPEPFLTFLQKLEGQELLTANQQSEYVRSHPLTRNRIETVRAKIKKSDYRGEAYPKAWLDQHARMKAKLTGFINPERVEWEYDVTDNTLPALYARTVANYRLNHVEKSLAQVDELIRREPSNAYFYELKGQMLVDFGRVAEGKREYQRALKIMPTSGLIRTALAHAQIETANEDKAALLEAINNLKRAAQDEPRSTRVQRLLATAYGRIGKDAYARLHLAEEALLQRKFDYATQQANIALKGLPTTSPAALRAKDILHYVEQRKASRS